MIAAIYARVSHKDEGDDRTRSVARQVQDARAYGARKGWTVDDEHIYIDDEVSAVDWGKRHAWDRLTDNLGRFGALLVWEQSRIGRDAQALVALERVEEAGVKVWNYEQDRPISLLDESDEVQAVVGNLVDRMERRRARTRAITARRNRVANGGVGGGRVLGYRNVGEAKTKRREVDPEQAALVVRLFEMRTKGLGYVKTAKVLNAENIPNPTGQDRLGKRKLVSGMWSPTGIRAVLNNRLYLGEIVDGITQNERRANKRIRVAGTRPRIERKDESLRIVSNELWQQAHKPLGRDQEKYARRADGRLAGKPSSAYLLTDFIECGICHGPMWVSKKTGQRGRPQMVYICGTHRSRPGACTHDKGVPAAELHVAVLAQVKKYLAGPMIVDHFLKQCAAPRKNAEERAGLTERIAALTAEIDRGAALVFSGNAPAAIVEGLRQREAERRDLQAKLEHLDGLSLADLPDLKTPEGIAAWQASLAPVLAVLHDGLDGDPALARQHLRWVLPRKITVTPIEGPDGAVAWKVEGPVGFEGVAYYLDGTKENRRVDETLSGRVTRTGRCRSQNWWPRGDSNTRHAV